MFSEALATTAPSEIVVRQVETVQSGAMNTKYNVGTLQTSSLDGGTGRPTIQVETDKVSDVQRVLQFQIDNTGVGNDQQRLRIGSIAGLPDSYVRLGLNDSAADDTVIEDDNGAGCKKLQAFSQFVSFKPVITSKFKVICSDVTQLTQSLKHCRLQMDGSTPLQNTINMAYTQSLSDNRTNLVYVDVNKVLDSTQYFEYVINAGVRATIFIEIAGFSNNETFTQLMGVN